MSGARATGVMPSLLLLRLLRLLLRAWLLLLLLKLGLHHQLHQLLAARARVVQPLIHRCRREPCVAAVEPVVAAAAGAESAVSVRLPACSRRSRRRHCGVLPSTPPASQTPDRLPPSALALSLT